MLKLLLISILSLSVLISCNDDDESDKLPNGSEALPLLGQS